MPTKLFRRLLCCCPIVAMLLLPSGGLSAASVPQFKIPKEYKITEKLCIIDKPEFHEVIKPLAELIARGEGDYNSVNRGFAGDTPGGIRTVKGKTFENFTVGQVIEMQRTSLYAVGRYQFIPSTLRFAVELSEVSRLDMFTPEVQDKLFAALVLYKRPAIAAYVRGDHNLIGWALDELAKEWASVEYRHGRGFYDHIGGNRASIMRHEAKEALNQSRNNHK